MKPSGFSLVELLIVIALFSLLMAIAAMPFGRMTRKSNIEKQITEMYQDIVRAQQLAMQTKRRHRITFNPNTMVIRRLDNDTGEAGTDILTKALSIAINVQPVTEFNTKGIIFDIIPRSICIFSDDGPSVDSIMITQSQISLGKIINQGAGCDSGNIYRK